MKEIKSPIPASVWDEYFPKPEPIPDGFLTASQIAKQQGVCPNTVARRMKALESIGTVEARDFRIGKYTARHYRLIKKTK
jgi:predicted ArsR family transcriptional regulator